MTEQEHSERLLARQGLSERVDAIGTSGGKATVSTLVREPTEVPALLERDLQGPILKALLAHPKVAFAWRANSGKFKLDDLYGMRWIVVNFKGCSDLLFMTINGRFGACEVKREGETANSDQQAFLDRVNTNGGLAFIASSVADVYAAIPL
jgi:hypothetical protein